VDIKGSKVEKNQRFLNLKKKMETNLRLMS